MPLNINSYFALYLFVLNSIGFISMWIDKKAAQNKQYRISEKFLIIISMFGASIGVWYAMYKFHHKTKKSIFVFGVPLILVVQLIVIYIYSNSFNLKL